MVTPCGLDTTILWQCLSVFISLNEKSKTQINRRAISIIFVFSAGASGYRWELLFGLGMQVQAWDVAHRETCSRPLEVLAQSWECRVCLSCQCSFRSTAGITFWVLCCKCYFLKGLSVSITEPAHCPCPSPAFKSNHKQGTPDREILVCLKPCSKMVICLVQKSFLIPQSLSLGLEKAVQPHSVLLPLAAEAEEL